MTPDMLLIAAVLAAILPLTAAIAAILGFNGGEPNSNKKEREYMALALRRPNHRPRHKKMAVVYVPNYRAR